MSKSERYIELRGQLTDTLNSLNGLMHDTLNSERPDRYPSDHASSMIWFFQGYMKSLVNTFAENHSTNAYDIKQLRDLEAYLQAMETKQNELFLNEVENSINERK